MGVCPRSAISINCLLNADNVLVPGRFVAVMGVWDDALSCDRPKCYFTKKSRPPRACPGKPGPAQPTIRPRAKPALALNPAAIANSCGKSRPQEYWIIPNEYRNAPLDSASPFAALLRHT